MVDPSQGMLDPAGQPPMQPGQPPMQPGQPPMQPGQPPQGSAPQAERDYQSNPLGPEDKDDLDKFVIQATRLIHSPESRDKILGRIRGKEHPYDELADTALTIVNRLEQESKKEGKPYDPAIKIMGGIEIVDMLAELTTGAGKTPEIPEEDKKFILGQAIQKYYQQKLATGEITKEQAARDAHIASTLQAQMAGQDVSGVGDRLGATQGIKQQQKQAMVQPGQQAAMGNMKAPQPEPDPMNPRTTMKEVLGGGLIDG